MTTKKNVRLETWNGVVVTCAARESQTNNESVRNSRKELKIENNNPFHFRHVYVSTLNVKSIRC